MIPGRHSSGYQQIGIEGEAMSIIMDEKSAHTMSSVIYSDHRKKEAVIRELCTNATDAHIMAGKEAVPIEVTLPTVEFPYLMVKDHGIGISKEDGIKYFTSFFASGSQLEEKPTGYYGLGAKSPHAYTDAYEIIMIKDGLKSVMLCFKNEEGIPSYRLLTEDLATDEPNGVSFKVPVMEKDFGDFARAAFYVLPMFRTTPIVVGNSERAQEAFVHMRKHEEAAVDIGGIKIMLSGGDNAPSALRVHPSHGTLSILMGNILYPVDIMTYQKHGLINKDGHLIKLYQELKRADLAMTLHIDIVKYGMRVEPGRERIITNAKNMAIMESVAERVVKMLYAEAKKEAAGRTPWQISKQVILGEGFHKLMERDPFTYLKYQFLGAGEYVTNSQMNPLLDQYDVKATVARSDATLTTTSSMSSTRFISSKQGELSPRVIRKIVVVDDRKIKVGEIAGFLLKQCVVEGHIHVGHGASTRTLGLMIRPNSKKGDPKAFADKMFGEGEYIMASELLNREFDTSTHDEMNKKTVRLVQFSSHYGSWNYNQGFAISPLVLKSHGTRAIPQRRISTNAFLVMTEQEFEEKKEEVEFLFRHVNRNPPNILLNKDPIEAHGAYYSLDEYVKGKHQYYGIGNKFISIVAKHAISVALESLISDMRVYIEGDAEFNTIHDTLISIIEKSGKLDMVLPHAIEQWQKLFLKSRASHLVLGSTDREVAIAKNALEKYELLSSKEISDTQDAFEKNIEGITEMMKDILLMLRAQPLEMQYIFSISTEKMRELEKTLLKESNFDTQNIIQQLKKSISQQKHQKAA